MDKNKLAVLVNLYGIDETANLLQSESGIIEKGISGTPLTRTEKADLDIGYANLEKQTVMNENDILDNIDEIVTDSELSANIQDRIDYIGLDAARRELENFDDVFADLTDKEHKKLTKLFDNDADTIDIYEIEQTAIVLADSQNLLNDYSLSSKLTEAYARNQITNSQLNDLYSLWGNLTPSQSTKILDYLDEDKTRSASLITQLYLEEEDLFNNYTESEFWAWYRDNFGDVSP